MKSRFLLASAAVAAAVGLVPGIAGAQTLIVENQGPRDVTINTRVLRRHVYENRVNTLNLHTPRGYRKVWKDGRLNPRRTESTLRDPVLYNSHVPHGYRRAWHDGRLNRWRANAASPGEAQSARIWTRTVPRELVDVTTQRPVLGINRPDDGTIRARWTAGSDR